MNIVLNRITKRDTLIPPPVLPAQAPTNISITRIIWDVFGHRAKSVVVKPAVVIIEATWKEDLVIVSNNPWHIEYMLHDITTMENRIIPR